VSRIEQSGRMSRRPKHPIKGGSAPEEEETSVESDDFQGTHNQSINQSAPAQNSINIKQKMHAKFYSCPEIK